MPRTQPRCSPSRRGKLYPSSQVEESPSTVTPRLDMLALRILHCHDESTGAGPDRPWASRSITRRKRTSLQEVAHTPLCCACTMRAYHHAEAPREEVILFRLHHHAEGLVPRRRLKSRRRVSAY